MDFNSIASQYGLAIAILLFGFVGFFAAIVRGDLVPGRTHTDVKDDRDYWRGVAMRGIKAAEGAVQLAGPPRRK